MSCFTATCPDVSPGVHYYTATHSFAQRKVKQLSVHLVFAHQVPEWVRVYDCTQGEEPQLLLHLHPFRNDGQTCEFLDAVDDVPRRAMRVYVYRVGDWLRVGQSPANCHNCVSSKRYIGKRQFHQDALSERAGLAV